MKLQIQTLRGLYFTYYTTQAVLLPFLPIYFELKGYNSVQTGFLLMIGSFFAVFAQPFWGYISDRFNTVKRIVILLWALTIVSSVGLFLTEGFTFSLIFVLLLYFFMLPSVPLIDSLTLYTIRDSGMSYGAVRTFGSIGFAVTAMASGVLLAWVGGVGNMHILYWVLWIVPMILIFWLKDHDAPAARVTVQSLKRVLTPELLWFLLLVFLLMVPHRMNDALLTLHLRDVMNASDNVISWAWAVATISEALTFALLGRYLLRYHEVALLAVVSFLYTIRWLLYSWVEDPLAVVFLQASHSVTFAVFWLVSVHYVSRVVPDEFRATGQALLSAVFLGIAGMVGGTAGGWVRDSFGGDTMYLWGAVFALLSGILFTLTRWMQRRKGQF